MRFYTKCLLKLFKVYGSQASHKMVVLNAIARSNWTVYDFHARSTREIKPFDAAG